MKRTIFESPDKVWRILEIADETFTLDDLKGDTYKPELHPSIDADQIRREEIAFEQLVEREGVYGYVLELWNPEPGKGYEHFDSCWGFVGQYVQFDDQFGHYIVDEMKQKIA